MPFYRQKIPLLVSEIILILGLLLALVGWQAQWLANQTYLLGTDAYYLVVQAQSVLTLGHLKIHDANPIPFAIAGLMNLGLPAQLSTSIALSLVWAVLILGISFLGLQGARVNFVALLIAILAASSPALLYHSLEFPKASLALAFVPFWFLSIQQGHPRLGILFVFVSLILHSSLLPAGILFIVLICPRSFPSRRFIFGAALFLLVTTIIWIRVQPKILAGFLERLGDGSAGYSSGLPLLLTRTDILPALRSEVLFWYVVLAICAATAMYARAFRVAAFSAALLLTAMLPSSRVELFGLGERLASLNIGVIACASLFVLSGASSNLQSYGDLRNFRLGKWPLAIIVSIAAISIGWRSALVSRELPTAEYQGFSPIVAFLSDKKIPMLIAHRRFAFYYTSVTGRDAFSFDPETHWPILSIWRLVAEVEPAEIAHGLNGEVCRWDGDNVLPVPGSKNILVREDCWQGLRSRISQTDDPDLFRRVWNNDINPSAQRPKFLQERNPISEHDVFSPTQLPKTR
jgi:hypothetical protein